MKRLEILLVVGFVMTLSFVVRSQPAAPQQPPNATAPNQDGPKGYLPGLGEFMGRIQVDHAKLWLAGEARNWELADYQLSELKEVFSDVQDFVPRYHNVPVGDMIDAIITGRPCCARVRNAHPGNAGPLFRSRPRCHGDRRWTRADARPANSCNDRVGVF